MLSRPFTTFWCATGLLPLARCASRLLLGASQPQDQCTSPVLRLDCDDCSRPRSILTDEHLRVKGSDGSIWAIGDAATIDQPKVRSSHTTGSCACLFYVNSSGCLAGSTAESAWSRGHAMLVRMAAKPGVCHLCHSGASVLPKPDPACVGNLCTLLALETHRVHVPDLETPPCMHEPRHPPAALPDQALDYAEELFREADKNGDDVLCLNELRAVMNEASSRFSHLQVGAVCALSCVLFSATLALGCLPVLSTACRGSPCFVATAAGSSAICHCGPCSIVWEARAQAAA